jgi:protease-4
LLALLLVLILAGEAWSFFGDFLFGDAMTHHHGPRLEETVLEHGDSHNKIAVVPIEGVIMSASFDHSGYNMVRYVQDQLKAAARDEHVKAVILRVNSPGGEVLASDDISRAIAEFQEKTKKPVIAAMGGLAASGGYYVSAPCRWIVANELTITGSIGVIMHGYNYRGLMNKVGLRPQVFKSGRFKDMLSGEKDLDKLTPAEQADLEVEEAMVQRLIDQTFAKFKSVVAQGRQQANQKNKSGGEPGRALSAKWADFADGRVLSGREAHELGFVDELGSWETAVKRAQTLAGIKSADLVQYQQIFDITSLFRLFGKTEAPSIKLDLGLDMPKLQPARLYFLTPIYLR